MATEILTDLQIRCDHWVAEHIQRDRLGDLTLTWMPDEWPVGANWANIAASFERVSARLRWQLLANSESTVEIPRPAKSLREIPDWRDIVTVCVLALALGAWIGLAAIGLVAVCGGL